MQELIAYQGTEFTIEWYYDNKRKSRALEYFENLNRERKISALILIKTMGNMGKILNITKFRNEGDGVYAFKPKPDRFLCFFYSGKKIIITNGFEKKQDKLPINEKKKALACYKDYVERVEKGEYYE